MLSTQKEKKRKKVKFYKTFKNDTNYKSCISQNIWIYSKTLNQSTERENDDLGFTGGQSLHASTWT